MTDNHSQSFFGQATGLTLSSSSKEDAYIFLKCIKKKPDGSWEKPSQGEGKTIRCSLEEIVMMLQVLNKKMSNWSSYHSYKDSNTPISFGWEDGGGNGSKLWINIGNYSKMMNFSQVEILKLLLNHLLDEKIEFATTSNGKRKKSTPVSRDLPQNPTQLPNNINQQNNAISSYNNHERREDFPSSANSNQIINNEPPVSKSQVKNNEKTQVNGKIKGETQKALLINFPPSDQEIWLPKSTIHSSYDPQKDIMQSFTIDNWILKRNNLIIA